MSLTLNWMAVEGRDKNRLLDRLGFEEAGVASDELGGDYTCARLPGGWLVFVSTDPGFLDEALPAASVEKFALGCEVMESATFSRLRAFRNSRLAWSVTHDPDEDRDGVQVEGEPPPQLAGISMRLQAEQAAHEDEAVDYIFEIPLQLAAAICGYRPDRPSGVEWSVLRRRRPGAERPPARARRSLSKLIRSELVPLLRSKGWEPEPAPRGLPPGEEVLDLVRIVDGRRQWMRFEYADAAEIYFDVHFFVRNAGAPDLGVLIYGCVRDPPPVRLPLWRRFSWKRFGELTATPAKPADPVGAVLEQARRDIHLAEAFLRTGERHPRIRIKGGLAKDTWPATPDDIER